MNRPFDPRLADAKAIPIADIIDRVGISGLRTQGCERVGPCPICGGRDRFAINLRTNAFLCRRCDIRGGDQIALVSQVLGLSFRDALTWLCGDAPVAIDEAELARRRARAAKAEEERQRAANRFRQQAIADARAIWDRSMPGSRGVVRAYLAARGITQLRDIPAALRFISDHAYVKGGKVMHRGPAMIAGILNASGALMAVHQTWVDINPPHGKARVVFQGEAQASKLVRGSKKGGAIRLSTPADASVLIMGEGIETTLSAMIADPVPGAAYWAGVDLGNMAGRMRRVQGQRHSGLPDMDDAEAFVAPPWVRRLIFIQDGDSDPVATRAKLESGLRRSMALRPGLTGQIVHAGAGVDLNDVLVGKRPEGGEA